MNRGLYPAPDEEPPVSVSQTAASLPRADAPLKPCPHCGGKASNQITEDFPESYIYFTQCDVCNTGNIEAMYGSHDESGSAWNRRDGEDARIAEAKAQGAAEEREKIAKALYAEYLRATSSWSMSDTKRKTIRIAMNNAIAIAKKGGEV